MHFVQSGEAEKFIKDTSQFFQECYMSLLQNLLKDNPAPPSSWEFPRLKNLDTSHISKLEKSMMSFSLLSSPIPCIPTQQERLFEIGIICGI